MADDEPAKPEPSNETTTENASSIPKLEPAITKGKHDAPTAEPPEADEFGLPVKPPRRRNYSLEDLDSPDVIQAKVTEDVNGTVEEGKVLPERDVKTTEPVEEDGKVTVADSAQDETHVPTSPTTPKHKRKSSSTSSSPVAQRSGAVSEFSHQQLTVAPEEEEETREEQWQDMPALAEHRIYDDWGKVLAKSYDEVSDDQIAYGNMGGAGKGYTRVQVDDDAQSATSMDDNTAYLFKDHVVQNNTLADDDEDGRDMLSQMQTTKELLTEGQRIAYVGVVRLAINTLAAEISALEHTKGAKKQVEFAAEALRMWGQKMMVKLYQHMDIDAQEQVMVEQLADHGVIPSDLTPALMQNARVKNPKMQGEEISSSVAEEEVPRASSTSSPRPSSTLEKSRSNLSLPHPPSPTPGPAVAPAYTAPTASDLKIQSPSSLPSQNESIDLDIRWTVLCDLFLLLIADSHYDSRSRVLLERVGAALSIPWQEVCRFEKRVTDALEMQEQADKENWDEAAHLRAREKSARNKRLMVMGLCTVGGGLIIGLSAGMLAPVIGAGLAAGFTTIGVAGTGGFLGGTGAAALIGTTGTLIGGHVGLKGANRRTGAVKTFEYRPLFNNKRVNLIVTVSGWMAGKVDDVRLPFSTVDPIMGDIYSVNWEPEMLQSTGQTIQILGTEALTQTIQQILGATFLATLMAGLSLPIVLTKLAYLIDNPWTVSLARADATGLILADSLVDRNLGVRPITLVGFSLGARVIFSCLKELARRGALGLVQNVYIFGSPVVVKKDEWTRARTVVAGRFVNAYATNDWILAYLFRATSGGVMRIAGLASVELPGVENIDVTETVPGHMAYRGMMPTLLHQVGWTVESEEFTEIEDPDPENHEKRQRELINEIEEARRELEAKPEKKGFKAFFSRGKKVGKRHEWETYDERNLKVLEGSDGAESEAVLAAENGNVMFDVDAIRREAMALAMEGGDLEEIKKHLSVKEIESTMPALKITSPLASPQAQRESSGEAAAASPVAAASTSRIASFFSAAPLPKREVNGSGSAATSEKAASAEMPRAQIYSASTASLPNGVNGHRTPERRSHEDPHDREQHRNTAVEEDEGDITLSFDESPDQASKKSALTNGSYGTHTPVEWVRTPSPLNDERIGTDGVDRTRATPMRSPVADEPGSPGHNPWAEEREVEMSFE